MSSTALTLREMVIAILQANDQQPLKPVEIASQIKEKFPDYCTQKIEATTQTDFNVVKQIANQISAGSKAWMAHTSQLKSSDETPRVYWWEAVDDDGNNEASSPPANASIPKVKEKELYGLLAAFIAGMHSRKLYPKRINEGTSANTNGKKGNKHLHPDLVAMEDLMPTESNIWSEKIREWATKSGAPQTKLWSFEVKIDLTTISDAREGFLQALANSAWANYGYLVAKHITDKAFWELKILHDLHGVGVILLDTENPVDDSIIKLPARERAQLDWGTCNRIATQNKDFRDFMKLVAEFHTMQRTRESDWDIPKEMASDQ